MTVDERIARIERQLRISDRRSVILLASLILVVGVAAQGPLVGLVCSSLEVKSEEGRTVTALKQTGDVIVGGSLKIGDMDIRAAIEELQKSQKSQRADFDRVDKFVVWFHDKVQLFHYEKIGEKGCD